MMTRKHYKAIGQVIAETCTTRPQLLKQINAFSLYFKSDNGRFQRWRFHDYVVKLYNEECKKRRASKRLNRDLAMVSANANSNVALAEGPNL